MTKLKQLFVAAAALVAGGLALSVALRDAGINLKMTCQQWDKAARVLGDADRFKTFWVTIPTGETPPSSFGNRIIGDCASGKCVVAPNGCGSSIEYPYQQTGLVSGHRVLKVDAHDYFAGSIKAWVESVNGKWLGGYANAMATCKTHFAAAKCANLMGQSNSCFLQGDGTLCRYGRTYRIDGPGRLTDGFCTPDANSTPYPCEAKGGSPEGILAETIDENVDLSKLGEP